MTASEIAATHSYEMNNKKRWLEQILEVQKNIPQPPPSFADSRPFVTLAELIPGKYVDTLARIAFVRTAERQDSLGSKMVFTGVLEDSTFKVPFVSHKIGVPLSKSSIYKFQSVYVHEYKKDKSLKIVATEPSRIEPRSADRIRDFVWNPKISSIRRASELHQPSRHRHYNLFQLGSYQKM